MVILSLPARNGAFAYPITIPSKPPGRPVLAENLIRTEKNNRGLDCAGTAEHKVALRNKKVPLCERRFEPSKINLLLACQNENSLLNVAG
jgi:hypothetical protein